MAISEGREPDRGTFLRRRDFVVLGSAGLASLCLGDLAWAAPAGPGLLPLPVAYLEGSAAIGNLKHLPRSVAGRRHPATPS